MHFLAFNLTEACRQKVLSQVPARFEQVLCHHITHQYGLGPESGLPLPPRPQSLRAIGYASDHVGVEALIVEIDGALTRPDGKIYHLTLSLAEGRKQVESNQVIEQLGWQPLATSIDLDAEPTWND